ncbi:MAG: LPS assembly lipoprotein LptE [Planctomycetota bacterium]
MAVLFSISGCSGWSMGPFTIEGLTRVYVPYFENETFYREVELDLTRQVISRIQQRADLDLADENSAELIIKGRIISYQLNVLSEDATDTVLSESAQIGVHIMVYRASDHKVLRDIILYDSEVYNQLLNQTLETARSQSFVRLSQKIVALLEEAI